MLFLFLESGADIIKSNNYKDLYFDPDKINKNKNKHGKFYRFIHHHKLHKIYKKKLYRIKHPLDNPHLYKRTIKHEHHTMLYITIMIVLVLIICGIAGGAYIYFDMQYTPAFNVNKLRSNTNQIKILSSDGKLVWYNNRYRRLLISPNHIPKRLQSAVLSIEDRQFYHEGGINYKRSASAVIRDLLHKNREQGGSTLTEQLVKASFFSYHGLDRHSKSINQKIQEIKLAKEVNSRVPKKQVMAYYMNKLYMGLDIYGMRTASEYYFGKEPNKLSDGQCAVLAGMIQSPTLYNPYVHPHNTLLRRNTVLDTMHENGVISNSQLQRDKSIPLSKQCISVHAKKRHLHRLNHTQKVANAYTTSAVAQISSRYHNDVDNQSVIHIPLNYRLQKHLVHLVGSKHSNIPWPSKKLQTAIVVVNNRNGRVISQIGGRKLTQYNRADQMKRSSGSAIKPLIDYAPAFDKLGWTPKTKIDDDRYYYPGSTIEVHDWDNSHMGRISTRTALVQSRNIPAIKALAQTGFDAADNTADHLHIPDPKVYPDAIGLNINPVQMAGGFSALADYGKYHDTSYVKSIHNQDGPIKHIHTGSDIAMKPLTAYYLDNILEGVPQHHEIGSAAVIPGVYQAGKTGTVGYAPSANKPDNAISDSWYVGYTKGYTVAVWNGFDNIKHYMYNNQADVTMIIYRDVMKEIRHYEHHFPDSNWRKPKSNNVQSKLNKKQRKLI